jgi:hypothetical protein
MSAFSIFCIGSSTETEKEKIGPIQLLMPAKNTKWTIFEKF